MEDADFDALLDAFKRDENDPRPEWAFDPNRDIDSQLNEIPFFMTSLPNNFDSNPGIQAIQALLYNGTPEEVAANFKDRGNEAYKTGTEGYRQALQFYTSGINQCCKDSNLNAQLYCNRSAVNLLLENYGDAVKDAVRAIVFNKEMTKAYWRAAKGTLALGKLKEAASFIKNGLLVDSESVELNNLLLILEIRRRERAAEEEKQRKSHEETEAIRRRLLEYNVKYCTDAEKHQLLELGPGIFGSTPPSVKLLNGFLQFPMVLLYPIYGQFDFIEKVSENDALLDHLIQIFPQSEDDPLMAPWDTRRIYFKPASLSAFISSASSGDYKSDEFQLYKIPLNVPIFHTLGSIIKKFDLGIIFVYILPNDSSEIKKFTKKFNESGNFNLLK